MPITSSSVDNDQFLKQKQITVERSEFLYDHFASKSFNLRESYDPKDIHGRKMSSIWKPGDTIVSVCLKRMKANFLVCLNPDTYSRENLIQIKKQLIKNKLNVIALILVVFIPTAIVQPFIRPRIKAIRRDIIFQYYRQAGIISRQLKTPLQKIPKEQMEKIISKAHEKVGF